MAEHILLVETRTKTNHVFNEYDVFLWSCQGVNGNPQFIELLKGYYNMLRSDHCYPGEEEVQIMEAICDWGCLHNVSDNGKKVPTALK